MKIKNSLNVFIIADKTKKLYELRLQNTTKREAWKIPEYNSNI